MLNRTRTRGWLVTAVLGVVALASACEPAPVAELDEGLGKPVAGQEQTAAAVAHEIDRNSAQRPLTMVDGRREGGALVLADFEGRRLALIADEDANALRVVDARTHAELAVHALSGRPSQLALAADGRIYVALRDQAKVQSLEVAASPELEDGAKQGATPSVDETAPALALKERGAFETAVEPVALATTPDGRGLLVVSAWGRRLQQFNVRDGHVTADVKLPRQPRGLAVSQDGKNAFVSHASGSALTRVALDELDHPKTALLVGGSDRPPIPSPKMQPMPQMQLQTQQRVRFGGGGDFGGSSRHAVQGFALAAHDKGIVGPLVLAHPGERAVGGYGTSMLFQAHQPVLVEVPTGEQDVTIRAAHRVFKASSRRANSTGTMDRRSCFLPRAVATDTARDLVLVSCLGTDMVEAYEMNGKSLVRSMAARWSVPKGPVGLAINSRDGEALVWSQFTRELSTAKLPDPEATPESARQRKLPKPLAVARATKLVAVAPSNGQTHLSPAAHLGRDLFHRAGDKRISRDGRACASCHPDGRDDGMTWPAPEGRRQTPILAGRLGEDTAPYGWSGESDSVVKHVKQTFGRLGGQGLRGVELEALMAYLQEMPTPPKTAAATDSALVAQGKQLFNSELVGCSTCHKAGTGTDGARHNVGTGVTLDTPSLRSVGGSAPYYHDGRFATLNELLRATKGKMGWAPDLSDDELTAIEAYLMTL